MIAALGCHIILREGHYVWTGRGWSDKLALAKYYTERRANSIVNHRFHRQFPLPIVIHGSCVAAKIDGGVGTINREAMEASHG